MAHDARRDPSQPDEDELLPAGLKRRPTLPFGMPAVRPGMKAESAARPRPGTLRPTTRPPHDYGNEEPLRRPTPSHDGPAQRRDTPVGRIGGFAPEPEDERFLAQLASDLKPHLAWLLGDRRQEFHRELSEGHLDVALDMLLEDRRTNPRNVSATKAAHTLRDGIRDHVRTRIGPMDAVPFLLRQPPTSARSHVRVLPLINGVSTIEDIIGSCQLPVLETIRALSRLQRAGCIDVPREGSAGLRIPTPRTSTPKPRPSAANLPSLAKPRPAAPNLPFSSTSPRRASPVPEDKAPMSSRLTIPEILVPFADDLDALGVGDGGGLRSASGVHPVAPTDEEPIADPTTPIPDGAEVASPISERGEPSPTIEIDTFRRDDHADAREPASHEPPPAPRAPAASVPEPVADPALDELGAIWRKRASRKSDTPAEPVAEPISERASDPHFPSIPALDPLPPVAEEATDAPASRQSRATPERARNIRFTAIVAVVAGLVIVAMFTLRAMRSTDQPEPGGPRNSAGPPEPTPPSAASPPPSPSPEHAPPVDTAPAYIDRGTVTFTIKVTPKYARVFLDDVLLVPVTEVKLRREEKDHVLRAEAPGFATRELTVSSRSDASLVIALNQAGGAPGIPASVAPSKAAPSKAPAPPPAAPEKPPADAPAAPYPD